MKVVLDANIIVSFLLTRGPTISLIMEAWNKNSFTLLTSKEILSEIDDVLARLISKGLIQPAYARAMMVRLRKDSQLIEPSLEVNLSPDKKDNRYLSCAIEGHADYLVSGDTKHLLPLKSIGSTLIISPVQFVDVISQL